MSFFALHTQNSATFVLRTQKSAKKQVQKRRQKRQQKSLVITSNLLLQANIYETQLKERCFVGRSPKKNTYKPRCLWFKYHKSYSRIFRTL